MKGFIVVFLLLSIAFAAQLVPVKVAETDESRVLTEDLVKNINSRKTTWTASTYQGPFISKITKEQAKNMMGALKGGPQLPRKTFTAEERLAVPASFDSRTNWPKCWQMGRIRDQSACGSCWAFGAVESMSDRECIFNGNINVSLSAQDMNSCCDSCGEGCGGGYPSAAWAYWQDTGVVDSKCLAYSLPSCDHHIPSNNSCPSDEYPTPPCTQTCADGRSWSSAKMFGQSAYSLSGVADMQAEIYKNGPVETAFTVYEDFLAYKSGVYQYQSGDELGGHAVKILGWGVENSTPYWLVANSWNVHWGWHGYFKILRGQDECGFEDEVNAGIPASN